MVYLGYIYPYLTSFHKNHVYYYVPAILLSQSQA